MSNKNPVLSVGLTVYNGDRFLEAALNAILTQTFKDFELVICDNASTDATEKICRDRAAKDSRIKYYRNEKNLGLAENFNRVFSLCRGKYFKWAAYDDLIAPNFLAKCVAILERDPSVVLCHSQTKIIDDRSVVLQDYKIKLNTSSAKPQERFDALLNYHISVQCFGVVRVSALKKTRLMGKYSYADEILLLRLALLGRFYEISEPLFFYRKHPQQSLSLFVPDPLIFANDNSQELIELLPDHHAYSLWFDPQKANKIYFPHWRIMGECLRSVWEARLSWESKLACYRSLLKHWRGAELLLLKDLLVAIEQSKKLSANWFIAIGGYRKKYPQIARKLIAETIAIASAKLKPKI
jgi:glycosyltransferase involved in cell wall biosynthesis